MERYEKNKREGGRRKYQHFQFGYPWSTARVSSESDFIIDLLRQHLSHDLLMYHSKTQKTQNLSERLLMLK